MSSAGHVSDMNSRLKNNREQIIARKERHKKVLDAYHQHPKHQALIDNTELSSEEYEKLTTVLHQKAKSDRSKYWISFYAIVLLLIILIGLMFFL